MESVLDWCKGGRPSVLEKLREGMIQINLISKYRGSNKLFLKIDPDVSRLVHENYWNFKEKNIISDIETLLSNTHNLFTSITIDWSGGSLPLKTMEIEQNHQHPVVDYFMRQLKRKFSGHLRIQPYKSQEFMRKEEKKEKKPPQELKKDFFRPNQLKFICTQPKPPADEYLFRNAKFKEALSPTSCANMKTDKEFGIGIHTISNAIRKALEKRPDIYVVGGHYNNEDDIVVQKIVKSREKVRFAVLAYAIGIEHQLALVIDHSNRTVNFMDSLQDDQRGIPKIKALALNIGNYQIEDWNFRSRYIIQLDNWSCGIYTYLNLTNLFLRNITRDNIELTQQELDQYHEEIIKHSNKYADEKFYKKNLQYAYRKNCCYLDIPILQRAYPLNEIYSKVNFLLQRDRGDPLRNSMTSIAMNSCISQLNEPTCASTFGLKELMENIASSCEKILVIGNPGIGKSTVCQYIAYNSTQKGTFWKSIFKFIVWIPVRELNAETVKGGYLDPEQKGIYMWLARVISGFLEERTEYESPTSWKRPIASELVKTIANYMAHSPSEVLLLFDGYDEGNNLLRRSIKEILKTTHDRKIVIFTRPNNSKKLFELTETHVTLHGFQNIYYPMKKIFDCVSKLSDVEARDLRIDNTDLSKSLREMAGHVKSQENTLSNVSTPFILQLQCKLWLDPYKRQYINSTISYMYLQYLDEKVIECIQLGRTVGLEIDPKELAWHLGNFAVETLKNNQIIFPETVLDDTLMRALQQNAEIRQFVIKIFFKPNKAGGVVKYAFLHLTLQEFFAAYQLYSLGEARILQYIKSNRYKRKFQSVFKFLFGVVFIYQGINKVMEMKNYFSQNLASRKTEYIEQMMQTCLMECPT